MSRSNIRRTLSAALAALTLAGVIQVSYAVFGIVVFVLAHDRILRFSETSVVRCRAEGSLCNKTECHAVRLCPTTRVLQFEGCTGIA